jgi:hypothetical protein
VALILLISIPIWTHPLPPLSDYINHLARMRVIAELSSNSQIATYYQLDWQVTQFGDGLNRAPAGASCERLCCWTDFSCCNFCTDNFRRSHAQSSPHWPIFRSPIVSKSWVAISRAAIALAMRYEGERSLWLNSTGSPFRGRGWSPSIALTTTLRAVSASIVCRAIRSPHSATI